MKGLVWAVCLFGVGGLAQLAATSARPRPKQDLHAAVPPAGGRVRTYYIAAEETEWDYAPLGIDMMTGKPFEGTAAAYTQPGPNHIGHVYRKAVYREYTDGTFATRKPRAPAGRIPRFAGTDPARGGRRYAQDRFQEQRLAALQHVSARRLSSEELCWHRQCSRCHRQCCATRSRRIRCSPAPRSLTSGTYGNGRGRNRVIPARLSGRTSRTSTNTETWLPAWWGPSSWPGEARLTPTALPKTWTAKSSLSSPHLTKTRVGMCKRTSPPTSAPPTRKRSMSGCANFSDSQGYFTFAGTGFAETNFKFSVNGYLYGDGPVMTVKQGQRVRWYLLDMGDVGSLNFHTPHWHGNTVLSHGTRRDTLFLLPLGTETADMVPDAPGLWLFHCHLDDHMEAGMMARYEVLPAPTSTADTKQRTR